MKQRQKCGEKKEGKKNERNEKIKENDKIIRNKRQGILGT